jgi:hypothetical protein
VVDFVHTLFALELTLWKRHEYILHLYFSTLDSAWQGTLIYPCFVKVLHFEFLLVSGGTHWPLFHQGGECMLLDWVELASWGLGLYEVLPLLK